MFTTAAQSPRRVAVIELGGSHLENVFSQLLFLKAGGCETTFLFDERLAPHLDGYDALARLRQIARPPKAFTDRWSYLCRLRQWLIAEGFDTIVFGTAADVIVRDLALMRWPAGIQLLAIAHDVAKFSGSLAMRLTARRVRKFWVLNDYLLQALGKVPRGVRVGVFLPIFFPPLPEGAVPQVPAGECWIAVPGSVESVKRDYRTLFEAVAANKDAFANHRFILGSIRYGDGAALIRQLHELGIARLFKWWPSFVPTAELHGCVRACHAVLPLVHPEAHGPDNYLARRMSGSFNLAFAYRKPLLMHEAFARHADFAENAIFYQTDQLAKALLDAPRLIRERAPLLYRNEKWTLDFQMRQYLDFIGAPSGA